MTRPLHPKILFKIRHLRSNTQLLIKIDGLTIKPPPSPILNTDETCAETDPIAKGASVLYAGSDCPQTHRIFGIVPLNNGNVGGSQTLFGESFSFFLHLGKILQLLLNFSSTVILSLPQSWWVYWEDPVFTSSAPWAGCWVWGWQGTVCRINYSNRLTTSSPTPLRLSAS